MKQEDLMEAFVKALEDKLQDKDNLTASDLNVVRQFLKDHDVSWETPEAAKEALDGVLGNLPDFDEDGKVVPIHNQ